MSKRSMLIIVAVFLAVGVIAGVGIYVWKTKLNKKPDGSKDGKQESIVERVQRVADLPKGEDPTVAVISDISKLEGQKLFATAKNGDLVLIYQKLKVAYVYRPSEGRVIISGPVDFLPAANNPKVLEASPGGKVLIGSPSGQLEMNL